jgi:hypothetical protein
LICATDLNLSYPKMIDVAVPANMVCGIQSKTGWAFNCLVWQSRGDVILHEGVASKGKLIMLIVLCVEKEIEDCKQINWRLLTSILLLCSILFSYIYDHFF